jgi:hypothetical protein
MQHTFQANLTLHGVQGVGGSNPLAPTKRIKHLGQSSDWPFCFLELRVRQASGLSKTPASKPGCGPRIMKPLYQRLPGRLQVKARTAGWPYLSNDLRFIAVAVD